MENKIIITAIFILSYLLFIVFPKKKLLYGCAAIVITAFLSNIAPLKIIGFINWNILAIFFGTLLVADALIISNAPAYIAELLAVKIKNVKWVILSICIITGLISAVAENIATVLIMAPIALAISNRLKFNPTTFLIALAISSNLQGVATLIGDPPSMILASFANMNFNDFFFYKGKIGIFFMIEVAAVASIFVLYFYFRGIKETAKIELTTKVISWLPTFLLLGLIISLVFVSFLRFGFDIFAGLICLVFGLFAIIWINKSGEISITESLSKLDWSTGLFLAIVFVLVGEIREVGIIDMFAEKLSSFVGANLVKAYISVALFSLLGSAFIDNVPFVTACIPIVQKISSIQNFPTPLLLFCLLISASVGGNISPIGASANIVAVGILRDKKKIEVNFWQFFRIGFPFTIISVGVALILLWFIWAG